MNEDAVTERNRSDSHIITTREFNLTWGQRFELLFTGKLVVKASTTVRHTKMADCTAGCVDRPVHLGGGIELLNFYKPERRVGGAVTQIKQT